MCFGNYFCFDVFEFYKIKCMLEIRNFRETFAEINLEVMYENYKKLIRLNNGKPIIPVIKANAYGHGAVEVFSYFYKKGVRRFAVAFLEEAIEIFEVGMNADVLIFSPLAPRDIEFLARYDVFIPIVSDISFIEEMERKARSLGKKLRFGIEIDTGMGRLGVHYRDLRKLIEVLGSVKNLELTDVMTHFPSSDSDREFALHQLSIFDNVVEEIKKVFPGFFTHVSNSGGVLNVPEASKYDFARCGLSIYGYYPNLDLRDRVILKNSMALKSYIALKKFFRKGESISYNRTYFMERDGFVGVIPCGYADGITTLHSNKMRVLVNGLECPVIGRITMDYMMVLIPSNIDVGDEVLIFGESEQGGIKVEEFAMSVGMIPYEVTCSISNRVPRVYRR